jgi:hypothetical protein
LISENLSSGLDGVDLSSLGIDTSDISSLIK